MKKQRQNTTPLSESPQKFHSDWTAQDCIDELRRFAEANPEQVISRNWFRNNSQISESTWNRFFGTFHEFKRQAGIVLSRYQHRMEMDIARHASVDNFRQMTIEKSGYAEVYLKPNGKRFKDIVVGSDVHDIECDPFWRRCFIDTVARVQPAIVYLNGDIFDLPEFGKYPVDPREWDVLGRIRWVHKFLEDLRLASPDSEIILLEGNHEYRLMRHLAEATPAMRTVLADLHGFTVPKLLGLDKYEVNYVARADLTAFNMKDIKTELRRNFSVLYECVLAHHFPEGERMGLPGWNGHHHKFIATPHFSPIYQNFHWVQLGAGHKRSASYTNGEIWGNSILIAHVDTQTKSSAFEHIDVRDFAIIGGKWYTRSKSEGLVIVK
jgi:hypothetical protein